MKKFLEELKAEQRTLKLKLKIAEGILEQITRLDTEDALVIIGPKEDLEAIKPWIAEMELEYIIKNDPTCMEVYFK